jgi:thioredoxin reductase/ferredoxin
MLAVIVGPVVALLIIGMIVYFRAGRRDVGPGSGAAKGAKAAKGAVTQKGRTRLLLHSINDDRCTGCDACVLVCPTDVLELRNNKSRVIRFNDCIQCEQCAHVCPTHALVMHYEGTAPPPVQVPDLDEYYQSRVPGLYLLGEAAGKPLVKNAVNLGRAAVEHAIRSGLRARRAMNAGGVTAVDVVIVGSGPAGLSAAMSCIQRGLSYVVLEKDSCVASTIARYPKGKKVMAEPYNVRCVGLLPVWDATKDQTIGEWNRILSQVDLDIRLREVVEEVRPEAPGSFLVRTDKGHYRGQRVMLAVGTRGKPRRLGVPGEDLPHVQPLLDDPDLYRGRTILVVGGGDSAVEAAVALSDPALRNRVILSYRGRQFTRVKARNRQDLEQAADEQRVLLLLGSKVSRFAQGQTELLLGDGRQKVIPTDHAFVLIGGDPPVKWLASMGIGFVEQPHGFVRPPTDQLVERLIGRQVENNRPGQPVMLGGGMADEDEGRTLAMDQSKVMEQVRQQFMAGVKDPAALDAPGPRRRAGDSKAGVTIMVPKERFLLHMPEKMQVEGHVSRVSELRRG